MASIDDVLEGVVEQIKAAIADLPEAVVYPGWPHPEELEADLARKVPHVSVYPANSGSKVTSGMSRSSMLVQPPVVTVTGPVSSTQINPGESQTITLEGEAGYGLFSIVELAGEYIPFKYPEGSTSEQLAIGLAAAINAWAPLTAKVTATVTDKVVTVENVGFPSKINFGYKIGGTGQFGTVLRTQRGQVEIHVWAYDNPSRKLYTNTIDMALTDTTTLQFEDCSGAVMQYNRTSQNDSEIRQGIYRRILFYDVEYTMVRLDEAYQVLEGLASLED